MVSDGAYARPAVDKKSDDELPSEYLASSLSKQPQGPPQRSEQEIQEEEELQLALALSQSEQEAKEKEVYLSLGLCLLLLFSVVAKRFFFTNAQPWGFFGFRVFYGFLLVRFISFCLLPTS